jgi:hypothetical protein
MGTENTGLFQRGRERGKEVITATPLDVQLRDVLGLGAPELLDRKMRIIPNHASVSAALPTGLLGFLGLVAKTILVDGLKNPVRQ